MMVFTLWYKKTVHSANIGAHTVHVFRVVLPTNNASYMASCATPVIHV